MRELILFKVTMGNEMGRNHVFTYALGRESAKRTAFEWLGGDPDKYVVTPLTKPGDKIHLSVTLRY